MERGAAKGSDRPQYPAPDLAKFWLAVRMASSSWLRLCLVSSSSSRACWSSCRVAPASAGSAAGTVAYIWESGLLLPVAPGALGLVHRFQAWNLLSSTRQSLDLSGLPTAPAMIQAPSFPIPASSLSLALIPSTQAPKGRVCLKH